MARIATWNLERPKRGPSAKKDRQLAKMEAMKADLWILTETHSAIALDGYRAVNSVRAPNYHAEGEACATILTRWEILRPIPTNDPALAVCAEVKSPYGPLIVYGSIIPYAGWRGHDGNSGRWVEHRKSIDRHAEDWLRLRREFPNHEFCFAGDYNQSRDGSGWYEDPQSVAALSAALGACGVKCVTECNFRHVGLLKTRSTIDHICLSRGLVDPMQGVEAWEGTTDDGKRLSDHNGVLVDIRHELPTRAGRKGGAAGNADTSPAELIIEIAAEGGGLSLYGRRRSEGWLFRLDVRDQTPGLLDEPWIEHSSGVVGNWLAALALLDEYPWHQLSPIAVHEEFKARVLAAVVERYGEGGHGAWSTLPRWRGVCSS